MLTVTDAAAAAVSTLIESTEAPPEAGLRFQRGVDAEGNAGVGLAIVPQAEPGDETVAAGEHAVFLAPDVVQLLGDQVLDAELRDDTVAFVVRPNAE